MSDGYTDLASAVVKFLEALPTTISADILLFVLMYAADGDSMDAETFLPTIRDSLLKTGGLKRMGATLRTVAALDHILHRAVENIKTAKPLMQSSSQLRPELVERFLAAHPLRQKHYEKALADWTYLRTTSITRECLADYEDNLLAPRRAIPST